MENNPSLEGNREYIGESLGIYEADGDGANEAGERGAPPASQVNALDHF